jgi:hypothetical protein
MDLLRLEDCIESYHDQFGIPGSNLIADSERNDIQRQFKLQSDGRAVAMRKANDRLEERNREETKKLDREEALRNNPPLPRRGFRLSDLFGCRRDDTVNAVEDTPPDAVNTPPDTGANSSGPPI